MSLYRAYHFKIEDPDTFRDIFIARLADIGFEGFVETEEGFIAYSSFEKNPDKYLAEYTVNYSYTINIIAEQNWNILWEQQIQPLVIDNRVYIKTSFHPEKDYPTSITIDPKMSFGTGHHETTFLMIKQLLKLNLKDKSVLDMGAGTGVLSILSAQLGAQPIYAVDNDKWAYENMLENFKKNNTNKIKAFLGDASILKKFHTFDIILANINRNILLKDIPKYTKNLKMNGKLIISGFYTEDANMLLEKSKKNGMIFDNQLIKNNWISITMKKIF